MNIKYYQDPSAPILGLAYERIGSGYIECSKETYDEISLAAQYCLKPSLYSRAMGASRLGKEDHYGADSLASWLPRYAVKALDSNK